MSSVLYKTKVLNRPVILKWLKQTDSLVYNSVDFLLDHFNNNEPISQSINITGNKNDQTVMKQVFERCIQSDANIIALDARTEEIVGVYLQEIQTRTKNPGDECSSWTFTAKPSALHEAYNNLAERLKNETDLFGKYPESQKIIEHCFASTHPKWLKDGVCKMAMDYFRSVMTKELQCDLAYSICTSYYSAKLLESCGYREMWRMRYDALKENEKCLFKVEPPHDSITFKMIELNKL